MTWYAVTITIAIGAAMFYCGFRVGANFELSYWESDYARLEIRDRWEQLNESETAGRTP